MDAAEAADENGGEEVRYQQTKLQSEEDQREYVACFRCTLHCFFSSPPHHISSAINLPPTAAPRFLKVFHDTRSSCLEIPQAFAVTCLSRCVGEAKLEGPSGWVWYAPFIRDTSHNLGELVLGSPGWDDFAHDHMLQKGDLLVLTYFSSRQLFRVRIFDAVEGIEKSHSCLPSKPHYVSTSQHVENQINTSSSMELHLFDSNNRGFSNTHLTEDKGDFTKQSLQHIYGHKSLFQVPEIDIRSQESNEIRFCDCNIKHRMEKIKGSWEEIEESENHLEESGSKIKRLAQENDKSTSDIVNLIARTDAWKNPNHSSALISFREGSEGSFDEEAFVTGCKGTFKIHSRTRGKRRTEMYNPYAIASLAEKERVEKEARAFHSRNPFVMKSLSASSIYKDRKLVWPKAFSDLYMPRRSAMMTWIDPEGKQWPCLWLAQRSYNRGISFISAGWAPFVNAHRLIEHDVCIFELINQDTLHFHVHIFKQKPSELSTCDYEF